MIEVAHRIKVPNNMAQSPRTIIARLVNISDRNNILRNSWRLKNSGIWINEDLCEATIKSRKQQLPNLKAAKNAGKIAYFIRDKLIVKDRNSLKRQAPNATQNIASSLPVTPPPRRIENVFSPHAMTLIAEAENMTPKKKEDQPVDLEAESRNASSKQTSVKPRQTRQTVKKDK